MQEVENDTATKSAEVTALTDNLIMINKTQYRIVEDHDKGFSKERIEERYNNVLDKYDYIVGDWGYDQLRFKGFYEDGRKESTLDTRISHLEDYLIEYCNFGCAYFVLEKVKKAPLRNNRHSNKSNNKSSNNKSSNKPNHKFHTRSNNKVSSTTTTDSQKRKNKVNKRRGKRTTAKKTFKIRKIGETNK